MSTEEGLTESTYREWRERKAADTRSVAKLIGAAMMEQDEHRYWDIVGVMQARADRVSLEAAVDLCRNGSDKEKNLGVDILSQMGGEVKAFPVEVEPVLLELLANENHCEVLQSVCFAVGHRTVSAAVPLLDRLSTHPVSEVRYAVVHGLLTQQAPQAIETLIHLSTDEDEDVRNWATFGLAQQIDLDTPEIRAALRARLDDDFSDVRGEALVGLAKRGEPNLVEAILRELDRDEIYGETFEAAEIVGDPRLVEPLKSVLKWWGDPDDRMLLDAIEVCSGRPPHAD